MTCRREWTRILAPVAPILLTLLACSEPATPQDPLELAQSELAAGGGLDAEVILQKELDAGVPRSDLAALLGQAALLRGDLRSAEKWLAPGKFSDATASLGFRMLGRLELAQGNLAAAGKAFDRALAAGPQDPELWVDIGHLRYRGGEQLQAIDVAEKALELAPRNAEALRFRGQLLRDAVGPVGAVSFLSRAVEMHPDDTELRIEYASTLGDAGRASEALEVLQAGDGSAENSERGNFLQAVSAARAGNALLARDFLQRADMTDDGPPAALLLSAIIDIEGENFASAAQQLDRLHRRQPDNGTVTELLALALSRSGAERELVARFAGLAASPRGSPYLRTLVGRAHETLGDRKGASRFLDLAAAQKPTLAVLPNTRSVDALRGRQSTGGLQERDLIRDAISGGHATLAVRHAQGFADRSTGSGDAYSLLGDAEYAAGHQDKAREAYERSASIRRSWPLTLRLAVAQDDRDEALRLLDVFVRNNPLNGEAAANLADAHAAKGDWIRAAALLDRAMALGMDRVPWVVAARSVAAAKLGAADDALEFAWDAHELQPMNPAAVAALIAALPQEESGIRDDLEQKLHSLTSR